MEKFDLKRRALGFFQSHFHQGRGGRAKLAISTGISSRLLTTLMSLATLPLTVRYLGNEGYGLMIAISSVVGWLQFSNMGLGLGLQNALTEDVAKGAKDAQKSLVSTAIAALGGIGLILLALGTAAFPFVNWLKIFPPSSQAFVHEIPCTVAIVFFGFVSTVVLGFVGPIYSARQELHLFALQAIFCSVITLVGTLLVVHFRLGMIGIVSATVGATALVQWVFAIWTLWGRNIAELRPGITAVNRTDWNRIFSTGSKFFLMQLCNIVFFQLDAMLIMHLIAAEEVTSYAVAQKIFLQFGGIYAIVTGSLWAAYGHAKAQGDGEWIRSTHKKMLRMFCAFYGLLAIGMIAFGKPLLGFWVGSASAPSVMLLMAVSFYFFLREWAALHAMLLNGLNVIKEQVPALVATSLLVLFLEIWLTLHLGAVGLAFGGGLGFLLGSGWYLTYLAGRVLKGIGRENNTTAVPIP